MKIVRSLLDENVVTTLKNGGVVVARTDTLYGVLARANDDHAVERVYALKDRSQHKSPIVLIADTTQLFDPPSTAECQLFSEKWPGPYSIIVAGKRAPVWLRRENDSVAYRMPADDDLRALITRAGPLIAPSANVEAHQPAMTVQQAQDYFGTAVDVYVDGGAVVDDTPSQLLRVSKDGTVERLR